MGKTKTVERTRFKAWITKYALSSGVKVTTVEDCFDTSDKMVQDTKGELKAFYHGEGRDWHRTRESAILRVAAMRDAKLASLRKQIAKLEAMEIEVPE